MGELTVNGILPVDHGTELLGRVGVSQQGAVGVSNQHQSGLAGFLQGVLGGFVEGYIGIEGSGVGDFLSQFVGGFARDTRFHGPMQELVQLLSEYEQYVHHCAALLDANAELKRAWRASRRRTALGWMTALLAVVAIGFGTWRYVVRDALATSAEATSTATATASATMSPVALLLGRWRGESGDVFDATAPAGADVKFAVVSTGPNSPYKPGDVAYTVTPSSDGKDTQVEELRARAVQRAKEHFAKRDANGDGALTEAEVGARGWAHLKVADKNGDARLTFAELSEARTSGTLKGTRHGHKEARRGAPAR